MSTDRFKLCPIAPPVRINGFCSVHSGIRQVGYSYSGEIHDFWECVFIFKGCAGVTAGETAYTLKEGQMILHPPGEFHRLWNAGDDSLRIAIACFSAESFPIDHRRICEFRQEDGIHSIIHNVRKLFVTNGIFTECLNDDVSASDIQRAVGSFEMLLSELLTRKYENTEVKVEKDRNSELYSKAVKVMKNNMSLKLSASEISNACGMSISTMQKLFYRYTGMGMMKYYESIKMNRARELLADGYMVKEVALELGFNDQNYFSTAYKRFFGAPPSESPRGIYVSKI